MTGGRRWVLMGLGAVAALGGLGVAVVVIRANSAFSFPETPYPEGLSASSDPEVVARGEYLVWGPAHCSSCHATYPRDNPAANAPGVPLAGGLAFEMGPIGRLYGLNLTPNETDGIGRFTDAELARVLRTGVRPNGELSVFMSTSASSLSDEDIVAVISYLRSLPPEPAGHAEGGLNLLGRLMFGSLGLAPRDTPAPPAAPPSEFPSVARGEYLAESVILCTECHRVWDMANFVPLGPKGGGGMCEPSHGPEKDMEFCTPNLTSHPNGFTGRVDEDGFVARMRQGRVYASSVMPWENIGRMTETDLRSVYQALRALPPVDTDVGPTYRKVGWTP